MAFVDIPEGSVCKAMELHHTYLNGKMINVEETKNGGKHSAVGVYRDYHFVEEEGLHQPHAEAPQRALVGAERSRSWRVSPAAPVH